MSQGDRAPSPHWDNGQYDSDLPEIAYDDQFRDVVKKLSLYGVYSAESWWCICNN